MDVLNTSELFAGCTPAEREAAAARLRPRRFAPGNILLQQGQFSAELHIIRSGTVSVRSSDSLGRASELARLGPGQFVGEMSLLTGQAHSATVVALSPTEALVLGRDDFLALLTTSPRLAQNISRVLSERLGRTNEQRALAQHTAIIAVASPFLLAAGPTLALNLAISLALHTRRRVLLATDAATLTGALGPVGQIALPGFDELADSREAASLHRHAPPAHPALPGISLCTLGSPDRNAAALAALDGIYGQIVLASAQPPAAELAWATGATQIILATPADRIGSGPLREAVTRAGDNNARVAMIATDLVTTPTIAELQRLGEGGGAPVLRGLPVTLAALADEPLPPLVRGARRGAAAAGINWLARQIAGLKVGLALGAGSARGFAHLGVLRVFEREGIPIDVLAGTSIGSIVAGAWADGIAAGQIAAWLGEASHHLLPLTLPYSSLFSNRNVRHALRELVGERQIADLPVPYAAVAVDLGTREPVVLHRGPLWKAMLASAAIPGIYPPVEHEGRLLIDGAMRDPLPTGVVSDLGADIVIGVRLSPTQGHTVEPQVPHAPIGTNLLDIVFTMLDVMQEAIESRGSQDASLVIHPQLTKVTLRQFREGQALIAAGEQAAEEALPTLRQLLPWL